jgi:hypothetical protein
MAGPLFGISAGLNGALRPGYDPWRHPISSLALGERGWIQKTTFVAVGALGLAGAAGLRSSGPRWGTLALATWSAALVGAGLFDTDPVNGYPPDASPRSNGDTSPADTLHEVFSLAAFVALASAAASYAVHFGRRRNVPWFLASATAVAGFSGLMIAASAGFAQDPRFTARAGLFQRAAIGTGFAWTTAVTVRELLRRASRPRSAGGGSIAGRIGIIW